jgi:hypothetical protein
MHVVALAIALAMFAVLAACRFLNHYYETFNASKYTGSLKKKSSPL